MPCSVDVLSAGDCLRPGRIDLVSDCAVGSPANLPGGVRCGVDFPLHRLGGAGGKRAARQEHTASLDREAPALQGGAGPGFYQQETLQPA